MKRLPPLLHNPRLRAAVASLMLLAAITGAARAAGPGLHGCVFSLGEKGRLTGVVPGANLDFTNQAGVQVASTTSGPDGYYKIDLAPGTYFFKITAPGYKDEDSGRGLTLVRSEGYAVHNFSLVKGTSDPQRKPPALPAVKIGDLQGRVFERMADGREVGLPHATVSLRMIDGGRKLSRVITRGPDESGAQGGQYKVILPAGSWRASAAAPGYEPVADPEPIVIQPDETATRDFELKRTTPEPATDQGVRGKITFYPPPPAGQKTPDVKVWVLSPGEKRADAKPLTPQRDNTYSCERNAGPCRVLAAADGYRSATSRPQVVFPGRYTVVDLVLTAKTPPAPTPPEPPKKEHPPVPPPEPAKLVLHGEIYEQSARDTTPRPLAGASVLVRGPNQPLSQALRATSDQQGKVRFELPAAGPYTMMAQKPGYEPGGTRLQVAAGAEQTAKVTLRKKSADVVTPVEPPKEPDLVTVQGFVLTPAARSPTGYTRVPHAKTTWTPAAGGGAKTAAADGRGELSVALPPGTYDVFVQGPEGFQDAKKQVVIREPMRRQTFILERTGKTVGPYPPPPPTPPIGPVKPSPERPEKPPVPAIATLNVHVQGYDSNGHPRPLADAEVTIFRRQQRVTSGRTDAQGRISFQISPGLCGIVAGAGGYEKGRKLVTVRPGETTEEICLDIHWVTGPKPSPDKPPEKEPPEPKPTAPATLHVRVLERVATNVTRPVAGASILIGQRRERAASGRSDAQGNATFELRPGPCAIMVSRDGFVPAREQATLRPGPTTQEVYIRRASRSSGDEPRPKEDQPGPDGPHRKVRPERQETPFAVQVFGGSAGHERGTGLQTKPLAGAQVRILDAGRPIASGTTDGAGRFTGRLKPGSYQVHVAHPDYQPREQPFPLGDSPATTRLLLRPKTPATATAPPRPDETPRPGPTPAGKKYSPPFRRPPR